MRKPVSILAVLGGIALWLSVALPQAGSLPRGQAWPSLARPGSEPITISVEAGRLHDVFRKVAAQAHADLWMSSGVEDPSLSFSAAGVPVRDVLSDLCEEDRCRWKMVTSIVVWDSREPTPEWSLHPDGAKPCQ